VREALCAKRCARSAVREAHFKFGELKNAACKEERQKCFKKIATKCISSFSKEVNDVLLIGIQNSIELHPYLSWRSPSCFIYFVKE
jgi:hypothetical protein